MGKYDVTSDEGEYQPGAEVGVLRNRLAITSSQDIAEAETELLEALYFEVLADVPTSIQFGDIRTWHKRWLGNLYTWAGELRSVNMSKGDFHFAAAAQLSKLVEHFERQFLSSYPLLPNLPVDELVQHLAETHVEFILIHPFREGNGRLSRLLMSTQIIHAGFDLVDFQLWDDHKDFYFKSIQAGVAGDYTHMVRLVKDILEGA